MRLVRRAFARVPHAILPVALLTSLLAAAPAGADETRLRDVRALVYSDTAAELFWTRVRALERVEVRRDGEPIGRYDASSLFVDDLGRAGEHRFELRAVDDEGRLGDPVRLAFATAGFEPPVRQILPEPAPAPAPAAEPVPASPPAPVPVSAPAPTVAPALGSAVPYPAPDAPRDDVLDAPGEPAREADADPIDPSACPIATAGDVRRCLAAARDGTGRGNDGIARLALVADLACDGDACCPSGRAWFDVRDVDDLVIDGRGHRVLRSGGQRRCSLVDVEGSERVTVADVTLDDDARDGPCRAQDECPRMVHVRGSADVTLERVEVRHSKGYAIHVRGTDGFAFRNGTLRDSGVLGLYIGHEDDPSRRVRVTGSRFVDNSTNALALLGVVGGDAGANLVENNVFERNHLRGQWPVAPRYGSGLTGGGQLYVARAVGVTLRGNRIVDGRCIDCYRQSNGSTGVHGIELGRPGRGGVADVVVTGNAIANNDGFAVYANAGASLDASVRVAGNRLSGNGAGVRAPGAAVGAN